MKYVKKKKKSPLIPVLCITVVFMLALIGAMLLLIPKNSPAPVRSTTAATEPEQPQTTAAPAVHQQDLRYTDGMLCTPYGDFSYPVDAPENLNIRVTEGEPYIISLSAALPGREEIALLDLYFGRGSRNQLGALKTGEGKSVPVGFCFHNVEFSGDWTQEEMDRVHAMQEAANDMLSDMELLQVPPEQKGQDILVQTPYGVLTYPGKWENSIHVEQKENEVIFSAMVAEHPITHLFTVRFGNDGDAIGTLNGTPVSIVIGGDAPKGWTEEEQNQFYAMQEDLNLLLEALSLE